MAMQEAESVGNLVSWQDSFKPESGNSFFDLA